jgi:hypothetical protein
LTNKFNNTAIQQCFPGNTILSWEEERKREREREREKQKLNVLDYKSGDINHFPSAARTSKGKRE